MTNPTESGSVSSLQVGTVLTVTLTPAFKLVFLSVLGITVLSMLIGCYLVVAERAVGGAPMSEPETVLMTTCLATFKLGFGAIIGLLGGKAI